MILIWWYVSDFFVFIFELFSNIISWFDRVFAFITLCIHFLGLLFDALPTVIKILLVSLLAICVIYKLLGRDGQS